MSPAEVVEKEVFAWVAPARPFKRRDRRFYVTTFSMAGIVSLILFLAEGFMPVLLIISIVFLYYVLSTVEPENVDYKVNQAGVSVAGVVTDWKDIKRFWFTKRLDTDLLVLETTGLPGRMEMPVLPEIKEDLKKRLTAKIPFEETPASSIDNFIGWVSKKLSGGNSHP